MPDITAANPRHRHAGTHEGDLRPPSTAATSTASSRISPTTPPSGWRAGPSRSAARSRARRRSARRSADRFKVIPDMRWDHKEYILRRQPRDLGVDREGQGRRRRGPELPGLRHLHVPRRKDLRQGHLLEDRRAQGPTADGARSSSSAAAPSSTARASRASRRCRHQGWPHRRDRHASASGRAHHRCRRPDRVAGLHRRPHPHGRAGRVGSAGQLLVLARRHLGGDEQLRLRAGALQAGRPRLVRALPVARSRTSRPRRWPPASTGPGRPSPNISRPSSACPRRSTTACISATRRCACTSWASARCRRRRPRTT